MNRFRKKSQQATSDQPAPSAPLRDFKKPTEEDEVLRASPEYKKRKSRQLRKRLLALLFTLILVVGTYVAMKISPAFEEPSDQDGKLELGQTLTASHLFQNFIRSNFGGQSPERLNTIKISGTIEINDVEQEFALYKKQPSMALLVLMFEDRGNVTFGMDGDEVWRKVETVDGSMQVVRVEGETADQIKETGNFFTPFVQYALNYNGLDPALEISDKRDENGLIEVNFTNPRSGQKSLAKIDGQTLRVQELENTDPNGKVSTVIYKDYEVVKGFQIPRNIAYLSDGEVTQSIQIRSAATNAGILPEVFKTPGELGSDTESSP